MSADMGVPFLGKLPLDPRIGKCCDEGKSFLSEVPDSPAAKAYAAVIQSMCTVRQSMCTVRDCVCMCVCVCVCVCVWCVCVCVCVWCVCVCV